MKTTKKVAPDGGWGWMACFGVSLVNVSLLSFISYKPPKIYYLNQQNYLKVFNKCCRYVPIYNNCFKNCCTIQ